MSRSSRPSDSELGQVCCYVSQWIIFEWLVYFVCMAILLAIVGFFFWIIVQPSHVTHQVTEASLTEFNYTHNSISMLHYNLAVNVSFCNPNRVLGVYYDHIEAFALYKDVPFVYQTWVPFFQHPKNTTFVSAVFKGQQHVPPLAAEFEKDKNRSGVYSINLKLFITVRFNFKFLTARIESEKLKVRCELHLPLKSHDATTSPDAAFLPTKCH